MRRKAAWVGSKPSEGNHTRIAVMAERFTQRSFGGGDVARETLGRIQPCYPLYRRRGRGTPIDHAL
jgi:hypothetical protein